jgi:hypothetical protein
VHRGANAGDHLVKHSAPETPAVLEQIVKKSLAKKAGDRYQKIGEVLADLQAFKQTLERKKLRSSKLIWLTASAAWAAAGRGVTRRAMCDY